MPVLYSTATISETASSVTSNAFAVNKGDLIVVEVGAWDSGTTITITDSIGNSYSKIFASDVRNGPAGGSYVNSFYAISADSSESNAVTATASVSIEWKALILDFTGAIFSGIDVSASVSPDTQTGGTWPVGPITTTTADDLLVLGWGTVSTEVSEFTFPSGSVDESLVSGWCIGAGHLILSATVSDTSYTVGTLPSNFNSFGMISAFPYEVVIPTAICWTSNVPWALIAH